MGRMNSGFARTNNQVNQKKQHLAKIEEKQRLAKIEEKHRLAKIEEKQRLAKIKEKQHLAKLEETHLANIEERRRIKMKKLSGYIKEAKRLNKEMSNILWKLHGLRKRV